MQLHLEMVKRHAHVFQILFQLDALIAHLASLLVDNAVHLVVNHDMGNIHFAGLDQGRQQIILKGAVSGGVGCLDQTLAQVFLVLRQSVKFADVLGEFIVDFRQLLRGDAVYFDFEDDRLSGEIF